MTTLKVGIADYDEMKARTMRIARGEEKPAPGDPKVWFTSIESFAQILSSGNRELLRVIDEQSPGSLEELSRITGRAKPSLSRTLKKMASYGLIRLEREGRKLAPKVVHDRVELELPLIERAEGDKQDVDGSVSAIPQPRWGVMDAGRRISMAALKREDIPISPGIYAVYRGHERMYIGKADSLRSRIWNNHSGRGGDMGDSALRRNIAEYLGIASSADIKARRHSLTAEDITAVRLWMDECDISWIECETKGESKLMESIFKDEYKPPLTKK